MRFPNWLKIVWWLALLAAFTGFLWGRYDSISAGNASGLDTLALAIWVALALVPVFQEVNVLGVKLKQEVQTLKTDVKEQISGLQNEIRTSIRTEFNPQINFPYPPPDAALPDLETRVRDALREVMQERGLSGSDLPAPELSTSDSANLLFAARHNIEKEIRRLWESRLEEDKSRRRFRSVHQIVMDLAQAEVVHPKLAHAVREIYSVCSPAIHGEQPTDEQIQFVQRVAPDLIATLRSIQ